MTSVVQSPYTSEQIAVWLQGLLTIAWADGHFDEQEKNLIAELTESELTTQIHLDEFQPVTPAEVASQLGQDPKMAENFLRTAVMVAIADGLYSPPEDELLQQFCAALGQPSVILDSLRQVICDPEDEAIDTAARSTHPAVALDALHPVKDWMDGLEVSDPRLARFLCKMIPAQCPFERDVNLFGRKIAHIPSLCKLNPLYDQLVGLRFRALSYLADDCGEDVTPYC